MTKRADKPARLLPRDAAAADEAGHGPGKPGSDSAFDMWLNRSLHQIFDDVAREPVPDELLRLIEDDRKA